MSELYILKLNVRIIYTKTQCQNYIGNNNFIKLLTKLV